MKIQAEDMLTGTPTAKIKWLALIEEVELAQVVISRGAGTKGITFPPVKIKYYCLKLSCFLQIGIKKRAENLHVLPSRSQQALHGH